MNLDFSFMPKIGFLPLGNIDLVGVPAEFEYADVVLYRKPEFHVTLLYAEFAAQTGLVAKADASAFYETCAAVARECASSGLLSQVTLLDDQRFVRKGNRYSVIQRCEVNGADKLHEQIVARTQVALPKQPLHITLLVAPRSDGGIGLNSETELQEYSQPLRDISLLVELA